MARDFETTFIVIASSFAAGYWHDILLRPQRATRGLNSHTAVASNTLPPIDATLRHNISQPARMIIRNTWQYCSLFRDRISYAVERLYWRYLSLMFTRRYRRYERLFIMRQAWWLSFGRLYGRWRNTLTSVATRPSAYTSQLSLAIFSYFVSTIVIDMSWATVCWYIEEEEDDEQLSTRYKEAMMI